MCRFIFWQRPQECSQLVCSVLCKFEIVKFLFTHPWLVLSARSLSLWMRKLFLLYVVACHAMCYPASRIVKSVFPPDMLNARYILDQWFIIILWVGREYQQTSWIVRFDYFFFPLFFRVSTSYYIYCKAEKLLTWQLWIKHENLDLVLNSPGTNLLQGNL